MNNLPKRKTIRLKHYDYSQNGYYFITICTHNKQNLFNLNNESAVQNQIITKWLSELENKFKTEIDYYVIMPDHIHFILIINPTERHTGRSLPDMMQWFKTMTTNEYIKLVKNNILKPFDKKLWQKSYYEHIIRNDQDYIQTVEYIINNPLKYSLDRTD
ncbi:MAG: transposase [Clostridia bacterium]|nr:transposase [Clostridia bacterium]